ncbi:NADH-quinone oxidoreductase subunit J [Parasphingorhabdus pacifica]
MTVLATAYLAQAEGVVGTGETVVFWILGPLALVGALGMVFARSAVHSALFLITTMLSLGVLYMAQAAQFLGFTQIIVYTGAIMMLFLFVLMMVGRDASDSVVEVLRGQRLAAMIVGIGFAMLLATGLARSLTQVPVAAPLDPWSPQGGGAGGLGRLIFTDYLFPFELTSALLITASLGAMVLAYGGKGRGARRTQRATADARFRGEHARVSPLPGPGVYATADSVATPALLPDGSVAADSLSDLLSTTPVPRTADGREGVVDQPGSGDDPHALIGSEDESGRRHADSGDGHQEHGPTGDGPTGGGTAGDDDAGNGEAGSGAGQGGPAGSGLNGDNGHDGGHSNGKGSENTPEEVRQ